MFCLPVTCVASSPLAFAHLIQYSFIDVFVNVNEAASHDGLMDCYRHWRICSALGGSGMNLYS